MLLKLKAKCFQENKKIVIAKNKGANPTEN